MGVSLRELRSTRDALLRIADSVRSGGLSADVFVVLLTLLLIVLVSVASYICASQGVCALSRYGLKGAIDKGHSHDFGIFNPIRHPP